MGMKTKILAPGIAFALLVIAGCTNPGTTTGTPGTGGTTGSAGSGGPTCPGTQTSCPSGCIDTSADSQNCGGCGIPCLGGHVCQSGQCKCQAGTLECAGSCVPSDGTNCGSCGNACPANQVCSNNACSSMGCTGGQTMCGTACVDTTASDTNCGSCGHACTSTQHCSGSTCVDSTTGTAGTTGSAGMSGSAGTTGSAGRGGTTGTAGSTGTAGRGGSTGTAGTTGTGGTAAAMPKVITSAANAYWTTGTITAVTSGTANVTVNDSSTRQTWEGFGGAFNEAGWSYIKNLSTADQTKTMQLLFDPTNGAHFVMGRIPIGASDYALTRYTEDETSGDTNLGSFSISRDMMYLIPYVKAAQQINGSLRFWASPWTPPTWMKTRTGMATTTNTSCGNPTNNGMTDSNVFDGGCFQAANSATLANYYVKWIQMYNSMGIVIDTIAPQNEPNYAQGYPSAIWDPGTYKAFLPMLKSALGTAGLSTKIMLGTMSNGDSGATSKDLQVVQAVMGDSTAKTIPTVMGLQWGMLDLYEGKSSGIGPSNFMTGNMAVWATEHKCGNYPWNPSGYPAYKEPAPNDQAYGVESWGYIVDAINKGGVTAYNAWNMVLDPGGKGNDMIRAWAQDALLIVNGTSLVQTPAYYVFRHASQYAHVGAKVISQTGDSFIAFKNMDDGSEVAAIYNSGGANANYIVQIKGTKYQFSMPGAGWATVVVP